MVDYSKWDNLLVDEDEEDAPKKARPEVTRFDRPTSVTIPSGQSESALSVASKPNPDKDAPPLEKADPAQNGARREKYHWGQTRSHVDAFFYVPADARARDMSVSLEADGALAISCRGQVLIDDVLGFRVEHDKDGFLDWTLEDAEDGAGRRALHINFTKIAPSGTVTWCAKLLRSEEPIDLAELQGRDTKWRSATEVLEEATELFKRQVRDNKVGISLTPPSDDL